MMVVLPRRSCIRFSRICSSVSVSTADRESSRISTAESISRALAMELLCFWPPERVTPRSPTRVLYSSGNPMILSWMQAALAALLMLARSSGLSLILSSSPKAIFSSRVSENRKLSWGT